jgi:hypothetical protein
VLLDPLEEEFDLPATFAQLRNNRSWQQEIVCKNNDSSFALGVDVVDAPQLVGVVTGCVYSGEHDGLIAPQSRCVIDGV